MLGLTMQPLQSWDYRQQTSLDFGLFLGPVSDSYTDLRGGPLVLHATSAIDVMAAFLVRYGSVARAISNTGGLANPIVILNQASIRATGGIGGEGGYERAGNVRYEGGGGGGGANAGTAGSAYSPAISSPVAGSVGGAETGGAGGASDSAAEVGSDTGLVPGDPPGDGHDALLLGYTAIFPGPDNVYLVNFGKVYGGGGGGPGAVSSAESTGFAGGDSGLDSAANAASQQGMAGNSVIREQDGNSRILKVVWGDTEVKGDIVAGPSVWW